MSTIDLEPGSHLTWLYFKLYPGGADLLDAAVLQVVEPFIRLVEPEADRWFFLRYIDGAGPHIRLRLLTPCHVADEFAQETSTLSMRLAALGNTSRRSAALAPLLPRAGAPAITKQRPPEVRLDLYEPELTKWGGPDYLPIAERVFQTSSGLAFRLLPRLDGTVEARIALGCLLLVRLVDGFTLGGQERAGFLDTHYRWWSGAHQQDAAERERATRSAAEALASEVLARLVAFRDDPVVTQAAEDFAGAVLESVRQGKPQRKPLFLAFHQLHLMLNRLGVVPSEEAIVSLISRAHLESRP